MGLGLNISVWFTKQIFNKPFDTRRTKFSSALEEIFELRVPYKNSFIRKKFYIELTP